MPNDKNKHSELSTSDQELIRVLEDVVHTLVRKGLINWTDLPPKAVEKLSNRPQLRRRMANLKDVIPQDDSEGIL